MNVGTIFYSIKQNKIQADIFQAQMSDFFFYPASQMELFPPFLCFYIIVNWVFLIISCSPGHMSHLADGAPAQNTLDVSFWKEIDYMRYIMSHTQSLHLTPRTEGNIEES